ncbi:unnamed protein product [Cuscuta epithymum]|uniref:Uncharacterized protein n=1 Tax=Cuscuta epithymum TaxID=186058 RepID=A0AAV0E6I7_9ASTE|nr:unnamed protein product [Cuscuta epithymum]CAH9118386.1 unnamed protein product [Cuscuta epithymum]CAH9126763.1 unnamed protein product [Cuscuta epithymum]
MEIKEKAIWTIVAGNVVAAICGIIALIHVPHQVDIGSRVIAAISIVCAVIALIVLGYQAGRRILSPSWVNALYWVTWVCTITGGISIVARFITPVGGLCFLAALFAWWYNCKIAPDSS